MAKIHVVAQIYGYAVCLVTVLTFLFSVPPLLESAIDLADIPNSRGGDLSYSSFDRYKVNFLLHMSESSEVEGGKNDKTVKPPDDQTLMRMYESERTDSYKNVLHRARRTVIQKSFFMLLSVLLFAFHWRWVRKFSTSSE